MRYCKVFAAALVATACGTPPFPPPVVPADPKIAEWPDTGAVVLDDEATLALGRDGNRIVASLDHRRRIKILTEDGLAAASVELESDELSSVSDIVARSVHPSGAVLELDALARTGWSEAPGVRGLQRLRFTIPGAVVGGLVEVRYTRRYTDADLLPPWIFAGRYPTLRSELSVVVPPGMRVDYRFGRGERVEELLPLRRPMEDGRERLVFVLKDLPAYYNEPQMPHPARVQPWLGLVVTANEQGGAVRRMETWDEVGQRLTPYLAAVGPAPMQGSVVVRYRTVRDSLRVIPSSGLGVRRPLDAATLLEGQLAAPRDAAALLLAALAGTGAEAYPALVTSPASPLALEGFPALYPFVRPLVAVRARNALMERGACSGGANDVNPVCRVADDGFVLLDPACIHCRFGELPWQLAGGRVVVLGAEGPKWQTLPVDPPEQHRQSVQLRLQFDKEGVLSGTADGQLTGNLAGKARVLVGAQTGNARDRAFSTVVLGSDQGDPALHAVEVTAGVRVDETLGYHASAGGRLDKLGYEHFTLRPVAVVGPAFPERLRAARRTAAVLEGPRASEHIVMLDLPVGYEADLPPQVRITRPFAEYAAGFERRERVLTYVRRVRLLVPSIDAPAWDDFNAFLSEVEAAEGRPVAITVRH